MTIVYILSKDVMKIYGNMKYVGRKVLWNYISFIFVDMLEHRCNNNAFKVLGMSTKFV